MTTGEREAFSVSGRGLMLALTVIGVLAFVLPPVLARQLHQSRVARAFTQVQSAATLLTRAELTRRTMDPQLQEIDLLLGPGDPVDEAGDRLWTAARTAPVVSVLTLDAQALAPDPWLHALQINVGAARSGGQLWVLSAGPNGVIDTPFVSQPPTMPGGDDIAVRLP